MTDRVDDGGAGGSSSKSCSNCGASLSASQRYCIECGARRGALPAVVGKRIEALRRPRNEATPPVDKAATDGPAAVGPVPGASAESTPERAEQSDRWSFMPSPQVAAVAVMALLAAGVVLGSVTSQFAESAGFAPIILEMGSPGHAPEEAEPEEEVAEPVESVAEPAPVAATAAAVPEAALPPEAPAAEPTPAPVPLPEEEFLEEEGLPEVKHVFLIVLDEHGYEGTFGKASTSPYFAKTLAAQGELIPNYYAVAQGSLANEIALLSGQGPTPQTATNCPEYTAIAPGTISAEGQVEGSGCGYPKETPTLPAQLVESKMSWKAYVEGLTAGCAEEPRRNPLLYFAAIAESPECAERDVGLEHLEGDLKVARKTPTVSYIVPNACHDGSETPCAPEQPAGLAGAEGFLKTVLPEITASPGYKESGLIAITFAQAPQVGPSADSSSCCATPEYPNLPAPTTPAPASTGPVKESGGGGQVGLLLISPFVEPGSVEETGYYNHFSLLLSIEELLGLQPIGYAAGAALTGFPPELFNAAS